VGGNISPPKKLRDVRPVYPANARAGNVSGSVLLEATIGRDGAVRNLKVLRGVPELDRAAMGAARLWRFTPTLLNGQPIEVFMSITMNFEAPR
jgi:protein TonB